MKINNIILLPLFCLLLTYKANALTLYSTGSTDWATTGTWTLNSNGSGSCGCLPSSGDNINILSGHLVTLNSGYTISPGAVVINIYGGLHITNTGNLSLDNTSSTVNIYPGGTITAVNNGSAKIQIGTTGTAEYKGTDGTITGPWTISNGSSGPNATLPVTLLYFTAQQEGSAIKFEWQSIEEENNNYFEIQISKDGIHFESIAKINANDSHLYSYTYTEQSFIAYARLKQVDFDGTSTLSEILKIENATIKNFDFTLFPNPSAGSEFSIALKGGSNQALIVISDSHGQQLQSKTIMLGHNNIVTASDINADLSPGFYSIQASCDGTIITKKLIVQ